MFQSEKTVYHKVLVSFLLFYFTNFIYKEECHLYGKEGKKGIRKEELV